MSEQNIDRKRAGKMADNRAHRIATIAAEEVIRCECLATSGIDEYTIPQCQIDDHLRDCIAHLSWCGMAVSYDTDDGHIVIQLGDYAFTSPR